MKTITETVTDRQIRALLREAGEAGDLAQAIICRIALGDEEPVADADSWEDRYGGGGFARRERETITGMDADAARAECARVIADAEARS